MRRFSSLPVAVLTAGLLVGCASKPKPAPVSISPSTEQLETIRTSYKSAFPDARVGVVSAVLTGSEPYALVTEIDTKGITPGTVISFLDAAETVIANGTVVQVDADGATVKYDAGKRKPQVGDAAVKF